MHIGLNLIFLVPGETGGMEVAARELIPALLKVAPEMRFTAFVNREAAGAKDGPWGELLPAVTVPVNARNRVQWVRGEQLLLPRLAGRAGVDLVHSLASTAPARGRFRRVTTVHDLIYARFPQAHSGIRDRGMRVLVPLAVRRSDRVIVDSDSTRRDLVELLGTSAERIDVVPLGLGAARRCDPLPEAQLRERLGLGERRVALSLSAKRPHKNLAALLGALARIEATRRPLLVVPGYATWHEAELREHARALGVERDVCFLGWLSGEEARGTVGGGRGIRVSLAVRGFWLAGAGGDGARGAGGLFERLLSAGGGGRGGAAVRSARRGRDRRGDGAPAVRSRRGRAPARAGLRASSPVHLGAHGPAHARQLPTRAGPTGGSASGIRTALVIAGRARFV